MDYIGRFGGIIIYLMQEGRGIGIANKIKAYNLQDMASMDTVEANRALGLPDDMRSYLSVKDILAHFHIGSIQLMSNNVRKVSELTKLGVNIVGMIPVEVKATSTYCAKYLKDKANFMGHLISSQCYDDGSSQEKTRYINFYEPNDPYGFLSNFYPSPFKISNVDYKTVEHYYQSEKFLSKEIQQEIISAETPDVCYALSRKYDSIIRSDWKDHRKMAMFLL